MRILECDQYSPEWWRTRSGLPTASGGDRLLTATGKPSASADAYMAELIDELVRPLDLRSDEERDASFRGNRHTERGNALEPCARDWHALVTGMRSRQVGMILRDDGLAACSPDSLIGDRGGLEIKAPEGKKHALWVIGGKLPDEHKQQVHFSLAVSGLDFWDFVSYCPGYVPFHVRVKPDEYTQAMTKAIDDFVTRMEKTKQLLFSDYIENVRTVSETRIAA